jgi:transcriptional regulator EpsA
VQENDNEGLSAEQSIVFMNVISESLRISARTHLFNWLQGEIQYLLGHDVMIFGIKTSETESYHYEYFTSSRYFNELRFMNVIEHEVGVVSKAVKRWKQSTFPLFISNHTEAGEYNHFSVSHFDEDEIKASELKTMLVHGVGDHHSEISSVVIFARLHKQPNANLAQVLELIMPHLHCALVQVTSNKSNVVTTTIDRVSSVITKRESEILQWLHMGKTNWEISSILNISPLTVKNHVQNILRKLDVQNRSQAAVKAAKLGMIKMIK